MSASIKGLGTAVPPMTISRAESLQIAKILSSPHKTQTDWLAGVYEHSGVQTRHQVLGRQFIDDVLAGTRHSSSPFLPGSPGGPSTAERMAIYAREAPPLALAASQNALRTASTTPEAVTHVITVSCTGFMAPGIDSYLIRKLGLSADVQRTHVGFMGCHGAINGLRIAAAITTANPKAIVLLVAVELCSLHYSYGAESGEAIANALFADGAAAVIITSEGSGRRILATGSHLVADSENAMSWVIGDHGFTMTLSRQIPKLIAKHLGSWLEPWVERQGVPLHAIEQWAVHPGGPKILDAVQESLTLSDQALAASRRLLENYGNMSSPTVLFILHQMQECREFGVTLILGFGPGLVVEAVLLGSSLAGQN